MGPVKELVQGSHRDHLLVLHYLASILMQVSAMLRPLART